MGVCIEPDLFQEQTSTLMEDLEFVKFYLENFIIITSGSFKEHLAMVDEVMKQLQLDGFKLNIYKCKFAVSKVQ